MKIKFTPNPKQKEFVKDVYTDVILYGGAAGGGKSFALVLKAYIFATGFENVHCGMFRNTYKQAEESLINKLLEFFPDKEENGDVIFKYNKSDHIAYFPKTNSRISFNYAESEKQAREQYLGAEYTFLFFDELTTFDFNTFNFLLSRLRSTRHKVQVNCASNPGMKGFKWVRDTFILPTNYGKVTAVKKLRNEMSGREFTKSYRFIPATLEDNPQLHGSGYEASLLQLPKHQREAYLYGNWDLFEGKFFTSFDKDIHVFKRGEILIQEHWRKWITMDWGTGDNYVVGWHTINELGQIITYKVITGNDTQIDDLADEILYHNGVDKISEIVVPHDMTRQSPNKIRTEEGNEIGETSAEALSSLLDINYRQAPHYKYIRVEGWNRLHRLMYFNKEKMIRPRWLITEEADYVIDQLETLIADERNFSDLAPDQEDHGVDMLRYMAISLAEGEYASIAEDPIDKNTPEYFLLKRVQKEAEDRYNTTYNGEAKVIKGGLERYLSNDVMDRYNM